MSRSRVLAAKGHIAYPPWLKALCTFTLSNYLFLYNVLYINFQEGMIGLKASRAYVAGWGNVSVTVTGVHPRLCSSGYDVL